MRKVAGLGAFVLDSLISCDAYPKEDIKVKANSVRVSGGGPVGNALVVMSRLGLNCYACGAFADDSAGKTLIADLNRFGVNTDGVTIIDGATSFTSYILLSEQSGTRTCVFDRGTVKDDADAINYDKVKQADILHLDGNYINCAVKAAEIARENGVKVSLDAGGLYNGIERLLPLVDVLIPSAEFALGITGEKYIPSAMIKLNEKYSPEILAVTDGSNGGYYLDNGKVQKYDGIKVVAVDTNGAGDTFHAAFLVAYADGKNIEECCRFASAVAAYKCEHAGVRTYPLDKNLCDKLFALTKKRSVK